jgi:hypothetical protein
MGYISTQEVKEIREQLKASFPKTKFSIKREHYSAVRIAILKSDVDFGTDYKTINECWIAQNFAGEQKELLLKVYEIASVGITYHETGDYGTQPSHYVWMTIGSYDKNFECIN